MNNDEKILQMLGQIVEKLDEHDKRFEAIDKRFDRIEARLDALQEDSTITRGAVNSLIEWAENVAVITGQRFPVMK